MRKFLLILGLLLLGFVIFPTWALGESLEEQYQAKQREIEELEKKIIDLGKQEKTLSTQITFMNSQIQLTTLKVNQTQEQIDSLTAQIARLEVSLDSLSRVLGKRVVATYKENKVSPLSLFFSSEDFSEFVSRYKYLKVMQVHDKKLLLAMEETRTNYDDQKKEVEALKVKLEAQKKLLDKQKKDKEYLLTITREDEKRYGQMLAAARAEEAAMRRILAGQGDVVKIGPVKAGTAIGSIIEGVSPCSSGSHLHFEVEKDSNPVSPAMYLKNVSLLFEDNVTRFTPGGDWDWPITQPIRITQEFGDTFWSKMGWYGGGPHTGIDMVSGTFGNSGPRIVRAVRDGTLYHGSIGCGGGKLRFSRVDLPDGLATYYLHVE